MHISGFLRYFNSPVVTRELIACLTKLSYSVGEIDLELSKCDCNAYHSMTVMPEEPHGHRRSPPSCGNNVIFRANRS